MGLRIEEGIGHSMEHRARPNDAGRRKMMEITNHND